MSHNHDVDHFSLLVFFKLLISAIVDCSRKKCLFVQWTVCSGVTARLSRASNFVSIEVLLPQHANYDCIKATVYRRNTVPDSKHILFVTASACRMTHAPPDNKELADINSWIDRHVQFDFLQHRRRLSDLLSTQMIARSIVEHLFLCRVLSIYAQTRVLQGLAGSDGVLDTNLLDISHGTINRRIFVGITANDGRQIVLRGGCADTYAEATVLFIETVLDIGIMYQIELLKYMEESSEMEGSTEGSGCSKL